MLALRIGCHYQNRPLGGHDAALNFIEELSHGLRQLEMDAKISRWPGS